MRVFLQPDLLVGLHVHKHVLRTRGGVAVVVVVVGGVCVLGLENAGERSVALCSWRSIFCSHAAGGRAEHL